MSSCKLNLDQSEASKPGTSFENEVNILKVANCEKVHYSDSRLEGREEACDPEQENTKVVNNRQLNKGCEPKEKRNLKTRKEERREAPPVERMISLGRGRTLIRSSVYKNINWKDFSKATRNLLVELFPREVLATHCLTGKQSPNFKYRPAKDRLNFTVIADVVETVCRRCKVEPNSVRQIITVKCADEAKMLRQRERKKIREKLRSAYLSIVAEKFEL